MKTLIKIRLINWHLYQDATIPVAGNIVITGSNGSGKTTLLDALHFVMSGGTLKRFNTAAGNKSDRTIEKYILAETGDEDHESVRTNKEDIYAHIALEFSDMETKEISTIGAALLLPKGGDKASVNFYGINGPIDDNLYFETTSTGRVFRDFKAMKAYADSVSLPFEVLEDDNHSLKGQSERVRRFLQEPDSYSDLLQKGMSPEKLLDINNFAREFLLGEDGVIIDDVKMAGKKYQDLRRNLDEATAKSEALLPLVKASEGYDRIEGERLYLDLLREQANVDVQKEVAAQAIIQQAKCLDEKTAKQKKKEDLDAAIQNKSNLQHDLENDEGFKTIKDLEDKKEAAAKEDDLAQNKLQRRTQEVASFAGELKQIGIDNNLDKQFLNGGEETYKTALDSISHSIKEKRTIIGNNCREASERFNKNKSELSQTEELIRKLSNDVKDLPASLPALETALREEYSRRFHVKAFKAIPLCNLIEISTENERWRPVLEAFLGDRRFDLFVTSSTFEDAPKIFQYNAQKNDFEGIGVVQPMIAVKEGVTNVPDSLADKVLAYPSEEDSAHKEYREVRDYLNALLGQIRCVDEFNPKEGAPCITVDGLYFDGQSQRHLRNLPNDPLAVTTFYIGKNSIRLNLDKAKAKKEELIKVLPELQKAADSASALEEAIENLDPVNGFYDAVEDVKSAQQTKKALQEAKDLLERTKEANKGLAEKAAQIAEIKKIIKSLGDDKKKLDAAISVLDQQAARINDRISGAETSQKDSEAKINEINAAITDPLKDGKLKELRQDLSGAALQAFVEKQTEKNEADSKEYRLTIEQTIRDYNKRFQESDVDAVVEKRGYFISIYNRIAQRELAQDKEKADDAYREMESVLRMKFINELRERFEAAKKTIEGLNRSLRDNPFGTKGERYSFCAEKNHDTRYSGVFDIASDESKDTSNESIFSQNLSEADQKAMDDLLESLTRDVSTEEDQKIIDDLCDYRNYQTYDLYINKNDGKRKRYSKSSGGSSGGENQTPFYALIAGVFDSQFKKVSSKMLSPCGLVLFDEAFNTMDANRITEMMRYYRSLNIQLIVAVPTSRFTFLSGDCDTRISLVEKGNNIVVGVRPRKA